MADSPRSKAVPTAILCGCLCICASVVYAGRRLEDRFSAYVAAAESAKAFTPLASSPREQAQAAVQPNAPAQQPAPVSGVLAYDSFDRVWTPAFAARAEKQCWTRFEQTKTYPVLPREPHFVVSLNADGTVTKVESIPDAMEKPPTQFYECVGEVIRTMKFPPSGKPQSAPVQATRPPKGGSALERTF
jgi:hypothetical protein